MGRFGLANIHKKGNLHNRYLLCRERLYFPLNEATHTPQQQAALTFSRVRVPLTVALISRQNGARNGEAVHD